MYEEINSMPQIMNVKEVSAFLGIPQSTTYDLMHRADFPTLRINTRLLVSRANLLKWMLEHTNGAEATDAQSEEA
jgi:predicted DNA-binding transcriptional regulator AlpA